MPGMKHPARVLWLPALAILLPCACLAAVVYLWLGVDREAARHRGVQAAEATLVALRADVERQVRSLAAGVANATSAQPSAGSSPPPAACAELCIDAFVFDSVGARLDFDVLTHADAQTLASRRLLDDARHRAALTDVNDLELRGDAAGALRSARALLAASEGPNRRGTMLLLLARFSAAAGRIPDAERYLESLADCCADGRDEYGTAFV